MEWVLKWYFMKLGSTLAILFNFLIIKVCLFIFLIIKGITRNRIWLPLKKLLAEKKHDFFGLSLSCSPLSLLPKASLMLSFLSALIYYFWTFQTYFRFLLGKYCEFYNSILITITRTVYIHLIYRTQVRAGDNTLQICWFYRGRYVFYLELLQLHWVMDFHSDQTLDPLHLQDKKRIKC